MKETLTAHAIHSCLRGFPAVRPDRYPNSSDYRCYLIAPAEDVAGCLIATLGLQLTLAPKSGTYQKHTGRWEVFVNTHHVTVLDLTVSRRQSDPEEATTCVLFSIF